MSDQQFAAAMVGWRDHESFDTLIGWLMQRGVEVTCRCDPDPLYEVSVRWPFDVDTYAKGDHRMVEWIETSSASVVSPVAALTQALDRMEAGHSQTRTLDWSHWPRDQRPAFLER